MTRPISRIIALTVCTLMGTFAAQAFADDYHHINSLARKIHNKAKILLKETRHYRSTSNYVHLVRDVAELDQLACHLRDIAKNEGDLDHMAADIANINAKFHHIEALFDVTELNATYGRGFIKGHTAHVKRLLNSIEDAICHIGDDIESLRATTPVVVQTTVQPAVIATPYARYAQRPVVTHVETYRVPANLRYRTPYGGNTGRQLHRDHDHHEAAYVRPAPGCGGGQGSWFSIGGGSSKITFRF